MSKFGFLMAVVGLALTACGNPGPMHDRPETWEVPTSNKVEYARNFLIVDKEKGLPTPPSLPDGKTPFGVVLAIRGISELRMSVAMCSVSHMTPGRVLANAHCLEDPSRTGLFDLSVDTNPAHYYVVFYDKSANHAFAAVQGFGFRGHKESDDVAVLNLAAEDAERWDTVGASLYPTASAVNRGLGQGNFATTIWSFDPISSHPELTAGISNPRRGAVFAPRKCTGFRTQPKIEMYSGATATPYPWVPVDPKQHVFFDECDAEPMQGNSGALVTLRDQPTAAIAAFHWLVGWSEERQLRDYTRAEYTGSSGRAVDLPVKAPLWFYFVGTDLHTVHAAHPDFL